MTGESERNLKRTGTLWKEFTKDAVPTMIFDNKTEAVDNPDGGEQASIAES